MKKQGHNEQTKSISLSGPKICLGSDTYNS